MGILRAARERGVVEIADRVLKVLADRLPTLSKLGLARAPEHEVCQLGRAESCETDKALLFFNGRRAFLRLDGGGKPDRRNVVARTTLPALGQGAIAGETEVRSAFSLKG